MSTKIDEKIVREDLSDLFTSVLTDLTAMRAAIVAMSAKLDGDLVDVAAHRAAIVGITAKLDADVGVTDINYATACDPAADTTDCGLAVACDPAALDLAAT